MKSRPKFDIPNLVSNTQNVDIDLMSYEQLEELDRDIEKKLSNQVQQINSSIDKECASINTVYSNAIDNALTQISDYFTAIQLEENGADASKNAQYVIQNPPQVSVPSGEAFKDFKFKLNFTKDMNKQLSAKIKEKMERNEELKKKL